MVLVLVALMVLGNSLATFAKQASEDANIEQSLDVNILKSSDKEKEKDKVVDEKDKNGNDNTNNGNNDNTNNGNGNGTGNGGNNGNGNTNNGNNDNTNNGNGNGKGGNQNPKDPGTGTGDTPGTENGSEGTESPEAAASEIITILDDTIIPLAAIPQITVTTPEVVEVIEVIEELEEDIIPLGAVNNDVTAEEIILDIEIPLAPVQLPKTGEIPAYIFYGMGLFATTLGLKLKRK